MPTTDGSMRPATGCHSRDLTPNGPLRKHYSCLFLRSRLCCAGTVGRSGVAGVAIEDALELWASALREVKRRIRPLFTQERVAVSAGLVLRGLLGPRRRKTGGARGGGGGEPRPWRGPAPPRRGPRGGAGPRGPPARE